MIGIVLVIYMVEDSNLCLREVADYTESPFVHSKESLNILLLQLSFCVTFIRRHVIVTAEELQGFYSIFTPLLRQIIPYRR